MVADAERYAAADAQLKAKADARRAVDERAADAVRHRDALEHRGEQSEEWWGEPCDPAAVNWEKYGAKVKIDGVGHYFWDACVKQPDGSCPDICAPYSEGMLNWRQQAYGAIGRVWSGACKKECRYTDDYMLKEPNHQSFMATSLAVLEDKVGIQLRKCRGLSSLVSIGCSARQRKIGALTSFVMKAASKAGEAAASGSVQECQERLPRELGAQLARVVGALLDSLQEDGAQVAGGEEFKKTAPSMKHIAQRFGDPDFCVKAAALGQKLQDPGIAEVMEAGLNKGMKKHRVQEDGVDVHDVVKTALTQQGGCKVVEEQLARDAADLDEATAQLDDVVTAKGTSALLQASNWSNGSAALMSSFAELLAQGGDAAVALSRQARAVHRGALAATGAGALVGLEHANGVVWFLMKVWWTLVALLYHAIIGTIYGAITTASCLLTLGDSTNSAGLTNLRGAWRLAWFVECPLSCFSYGWGINPWHMDDSLWQNVWED
jgi:hypothetical protein